MTDPRAIAESKFLRQKPSNVQIEAAFPIIAAAPHPMTEARARRIAEAVWETMFQAAPDIPRIGLTEKQDRLFRFIATYMTLHGISPSLQEIADYMGKKATRAEAHTAVAALVRRGVIDKGPTGAQRSIRLLVTPGDKQYEADE